MVAHWEILTNVQSLQHHPDPRSHAAALSGPSRDLLGNFPGLPAVYPDTMAPVVRTAREGDRELDGSKNLAKFEHF